VATYFADTSFWIGLSSKRDQHHDRAVAWYEFVTRTSSSILTTEAVLLEWLNALSGVKTRAIAAESYARVHADPRIEVTPFHEDLMGSAIELYRARPDKNWSVTDCLSFVVMERRGVTRALTTDRDFEQAGLEALMLVPPRAGGDR
jgi:predicted nucleic acid-binding protein